MGPSIAKLCWVDCCCDVKFFLVSCDGCLLWWLRERSVDAPVTVLLIAGLYFRSMAKSLLSKSVFVFAFENNFFFFWSSGVTDDITGIGCKNLARVFFAS